MTVGIIDTTVVLHYFRKNTVAQMWVENQPVRLSVTPFTWLEVIHGAAGKDSQAICKTILNMFDMEYPTVSDMNWAMEQMESYRLSHGIGIFDCLIASVCYRQNIPIYTHNRKDFLKILPERLVITPY